MAQEGVLHTQLLEPPETPSVAVVAADRAHVQQLRRATAWRTARRPAGAQNQRNRGQDPGCATRCSCRADRQQETRHNKVTLATAFSANLLATPCSASRHRTAALEPTPPSSLASSWLSPFASRPPSNVECQRVWYRLIFVLERAVQKTDECLARCP